MIKIRSEIKAIRINKTKLMRNIYTYKCTYVHFLLYTFTIIIILKIYFHTACFVAILDYMHSQKYIS